MAQKIIVTLKRILIISLIAFIIAVIWWYCGPHEKSRFLSCLLWMGIATFCAGALFGANAPNSIADANYKIARSGSLMSSEESYRRAFDDMQNTYFQASFHWCRNYVAYRIGPSLSDMGFVGPISDRTRRASPVAVL